MILEHIAELRERASALLSAASDVAALEELRVSMLGKKGEITELLKSLGKMPAEERPTAGAQINQFRQEVEGFLLDRLSQIKKLSESQRLALETLDVTLPGHAPELGCPHPIQQTMERLIDIFTGMGFTVVEGPEIEEDKYNFELLNLPADHPAREMQDTFYFSEHLLLRTHTSPMQARTMLSTQPPIRIVCPGRVFRAEDIDATHSAVFSQMEALVVDEGVTMGDLKGTLDAFAQAMYGPEVRTRLRPSYFPFTEPSAEVDVSCASCHGAGCRLCKGTGWIEILGAGMVNPRVLEMCGIDSKKYSGFAFGVGLERVAQLKYGISDMRLLFENDLRFLKQFQ